MGIRLLSQATVKDSDSIDGHQAVQMYNWEISTLVVMRHQSVHFSCSVVSNSLRSHGLQHARLPRPSASPGACSNSCHWVGDAIQPSRPLLLLPSIFPSSRISSSELTLCLRWPNYWSLSFSIRTSNEYLELISLRIDWFDLLAVQGTLKSLLQHHSSKASVPQCSTFFMVQLSHPYMTTGKTTALTRQTFVGKCCLCFLICCLDCS